MQSLEYYQRLAKDLADRILDERDDREVMRLIVELAACLETIEVIEAEIEKLTFCLN